MESAILTELGALVSFFMRICRSGGRFYKLSPEAKKHSRRDSSAGCAKKTFIFRKLVEKLNYSVRYRTIRSGLSRNCFMV